MQIYKGIQGKNIGFLSANRNKRYCVIRLLYIFHLKRSNVGCRPVIFSTVKSTSTYIEININKKHCIFVVLIPVCFTSTCLITHCFYKLEALEFKAIAVILAVMQYAKQHDSRDNSPQNIMQLTGENWISQQLAVIITHYLLFLSRP